MKKTILTYPKLLFMPPKELSDCCQGESLSRTLATGQTGDALYLAELQLSSRFCVDCFLNKKRQYDSLKTFKLDLHMIGEFHQNRKTK